MNSPVELGARAAARRLTTPTRPELAHDVEVALHTRETSPRPDLYADPTALGGLIVSIATLAWTVYGDIRARTGTPASTDAVTRRVRHQLDEPDTDTPELDPAERDRIIDVTVEETLDATRQQDTQPPQD